MTASFRVERVMLVLVGGARDESAESYVAWWEGRYAEEGDEA